MGLHKGQTNNPTGRPVGSKNKITASLRGKINDFLNDNWNTMQTDFEKLEPKERLMFYEKLLQYGLPKLQSTELLSNIEQLTDSQLDFIINDLKNSIDEQTAKN